MASLTPTLQPTGPGMTATQAPRPAQPRPAPPRNQPQPQAPVMPDFSSHGGGSFSAVNTGPSGPRPTFSAGGSTTAGAQPFQFGEFRDFGDTVMQEYQRSTAPEIERRRARMNQDLVNRGLTPGSEAYANEMDRFMRMENDLFQSAQRGALAQGLAAQDQAFQQSLGQAGINAGLQQAAMGANASVYGSDQSRIASMYGSDAGMHNAGLGALASMYGSDNSLLGSMYGSDASNLNAMIGAGASMYNSDNSLFGSMYGDDSRLAGQLGVAGMNNATTRYGMDQNYSLGLGQQNLGQQNIDNGLLMNLLGFGLNANNQNNQTQLQEFGTVGNLFRNFLPGGNFVPFDVPGAANSQANMANAMQPTNTGFWGGFGQLGAAAMGLPMFQGPGG